MSTIINALKLSAATKTGLRYIRESSFFDPVWYKAFYGIDDNVDCAKHYLNDGWKQGFDPSLRFSTNGYLSHYKDVLENGINPLLHYEKYGKKEGRLTIFPIEQKRNEIQGGLDYVYKTEPPAELKTCALFAFSGCNQTIPEYVVYFVEKLSKIVDGIVFIADNKIGSIDEIEKIRDYIFYAEFSKHRSFEFGLWKTGIKFLSDSELLSGLDELVLLNDGFYGPVDGFEELFMQMRQKNCDYWSLSDPKHQLNSNFFVLRKNVLKDSAFTAFFDRVPEKLTFWNSSFNLDKEFINELSLKFTSEYLINTISETDEKACDCLNQFILQIENGFPLVNISLVDGSLGSGGQETIGKILLSVRELNTDLYRIITRDLKLRKNYDLFKSVPDNYSLYVDSKEIVSFDVFDTLLIRPFFKATDMFNYIEALYNLPGFAQARIEAEKTARKNNKKSFDSEEVTIEDIYAVIVPKFRKIKEIELDTEKTLITANPNIKPVFDLLQKNGKRIVAASDMYLPKDYIKNLLIKNGYFGIEEVFVSSVNNHNKNSGELYTDVLDYSKCLKTDIVHFGDNFEADVACAERFGIDAYQIPRASERFINSPANVKYKEYLTRHNNEIAISIYTSLISNYLSEVDPRTPFYTILGYALGGCLALSYLHFVCEEAESNGVGHLIFVARDGFSLSDIYREFFFDKYGIPYSYVYLNRNVVLGVLDGIPEDPKYLYYTLKLAGKEIPSVIASEDYELNIREYRKNQKLIDKWKEKNREVLRNHILCSMGNTDTVGVVDMVTKQFSSLHGAKTVISEKNLLGLFTGAFAGCVAEAPYESFCNRKLETKDDLAIKFSEFLLSSPEESIVGLNNSGKPVFDQKVESNREQRYYEIMAGIKRYCKDYFEIMPLNKKMLMSFEQWIDLINCYCKYCNDVDKYYLNDVVETPDPDVNSIKNNLVKLIEEKQNAESSQ